MVTTLCSKQTIQLFLSKGVTISAKSNHGYNIIHSMILAAAIQPEIEDVMMDRYLFIMENVSEEERHKLLMDENNDRMRPLEFAMHNSTTGMFQGMLLYYS